MNIAIGNIENKDDNDTARVQQDTGLMPVTMLNETESKNNNKTDQRAYNLTAETTVANPKGQYSVSSAQHEENPRSQWQPNTPQHEEMFSSFARAVSTRQSSLDPSRYTLSKDREVSNIKTPVKEGAFSHGAKSGVLDLDALKQAVLKGEFDEIIAARETNAEDLFGGNNRRSFDSKDAFRFGDFRDGFPREESRSSDNGPRNQLTSDPMDIDHEATVTHIEEIRMISNNPHKVQSPSSFQHSSPPSNSSPQSTEELIAAGRRYLAQKYGTPSPQSQNSSEPGSASSSQLTPDMMRWLDRNMAKRMSETEAEGPKAPDYDPFSGNLTAEQEEFEARRCLKAAKSIFGHAISGKQFEAQSETWDWDEEDYIQPYEPYEHFSELSDELIMEEIDKMPDTIIDTPRSEDCITQDDGASLDIIMDSQLPEDWIVKDVNTKPKSVYNQPSEDYMMEDIGSTSDMSIDNHRAKRSKTFAGEDAIFEPALQPTPVGEPGRNFTRFVITPKINRTGIDHGCTTKSEASSVTATESPRTIGELDSDNEVSFIRSSPLQPQSNVRKRVTRPLKSTYVKSGTKDNKTTKKIFAVVESKNESIGGQSLYSPTPRSNSSGGEGPRPRPIQPMQPMPAAGYPTYGYQGYAPNISGASGFTTTAENSGVPSTVVPPMQHSREHANMPVMTSHGSSWGQMTQNFSPGAQYPQQFSGNNVPGFVSPNNYFEGRSNRGGRGGPMGFPGYNYQGGHSRSPHSFGGISTHSPHNPNTGSPLTPTSQFFDSMNSPQFSPIQGYQNQSPTAHRLYRRKSSSRAAFHGHFQLPGNPPLPHTQPRANSPTIIDCTPIQLNFPPSASKTVSRERAVISFQGHGEREQALAYLQNAAKSTPEGQHMMFMEDFDASSRAITISAPAGRMVRGWVKKFLPYADVEISMI
jgi:hypothetical protein